MEVPRHIFFKWGIRGLIGVILGVLDMKKFGSHCTTASLARYTKAFGVVQGYCVCSPMQRISALKRLKAIKLGIIIRLCIGITLAMNHGLLCKAIRFHCSLLLCSVVISSNTCNTSTLARLYDLELMQKLMRSDTVYTLFCL